jgi:hypothetical protein
MALELFMIGEESPDRAQRTTQHRPRDAQAIRAAIQERRSRGFGDYEVANAMAVSVEYMYRVLSEHQSQEVE